MKTFTLYWLDGKREVVKGENISQACANAGYSAGAIRALDFYEEDDNKNWKWDKHTVSWKRDIA